MPHREDTKLLQVALGMQLLPQDYAFPYYRDDAMLLSFGLEPYDLMLQLLAKKTILFLEEELIIRIQA